MTERPIVKQEPQTQTHTTPRTIGFLVSDLEPTYYGQLLNTLREVCHLLKVRLIVFEGRALESKNNAARCYNAIYQLVSRSRLDGLLVASSGTGAICGSARLDGFLQHFSLPVVTIGMPLPHYCGVMVDDEASIRLVLNHLEGHGCRHIAYGSGPTHIIHSRERLDAYRNWIAEADPGKGYREDVHIGNFTTRSGYDIMASLHSRIGKDLDAICFANDSMALGALEYCNTHGIDVPGEVAIAGIDNIELAGIVTPGLTSVSQNMPRMAQIAVHELLSEINTHQDKRRERAGKDDPEPLYMNCGEGIRHLMAAPSLVKRGSCGCENRMIPNRNTILQDMMNRTLYIGESVQTFKSDDLFSRMEEFLRRKSITMCFVLLFEDLPKGMDCHRFVLPAQSRMLLGYANSERLVDDAPFPTVSLLPAAMWKKTGNTDLMIKPLFFESEVFGYLVAGTDDRERAMVEDLRLMISVTLKGESLIKELQQTHAQLEWALHAMKKVNRQLSDISLRDDLTGLLNRRGFIHEATEYLEENHGRYLLGFADMNGLKTINDQFGHEEGDTALRAIADILRHCCREEDILARISGDEFAFVIKGFDWDNKEQMEARFEEKLSEWNNQNKRGYLLSFARGYSVGGPGMDLEQLMKQSDARMYLHKAQMKPTLTIITENPNYPG